MVTAEEIRKAWAVLKQASLHLKSHDIRFDDDESFTIYDRSSGKNVNLSKDEIIDMSNWVLCLFIYEDGE